MSALHDLPDPYLEPLRILLVEDDPHLRDSLRELLEEEGYQVEAVPSGADAIALSSDQRYDLMITDIKTPGSSDGLSALEAVKAGNPEVAGIVITGYSTEEYALRAAKLKVEDYLKKPFDMETFLSAVDRLAERKRQAQAAAARELLFQKALRWLSARLVQRCADRSESELDELFRLAAGQSRDPREQAAMECATALAVLQQEGLSWPQELNGVFPLRVAHSFAADGTLGEPFASWARGFLEGTELAPEPPEEEGEVMPGSLLNVALLLESAERHQEAQAAFEDVLRGTADPSQRSLALLGLARLALHQHRFHELPGLLDQAASEALQLGPITHSQTLAERGILLARARAASAPTALQEAWELARSVKDTGSYALVSLAREHFLNEAAPQRERLLGYLMQPEQFSLAAESSEWLMGLLLAQPELQPEERRFLVKLLRAAPAAFERLLRQSDDSALVCQAVPFIDLLPPERRERVQPYLESQPDEALRAALARWAARKKQRPQQEALLRVFSFSGIRLYRNDEPLEITRKKPLLLLLYLFYRNVPVGEETLLELFWPGDESKARATLRTTLSYLRRLLVPDGSIDPLPRQANALSLASGIPVWFDHREFEAFVQRGRSLAESHPDRAVECFRSAVRLYRGPFLENVYEDWAIQAREQAELAYESCLTFLAFRSLQARNWAQAYEYSARGLRRDPLSVAFCEMAMQAQIGLQRHREALQTYERCRLALEQELGAEPSIEMMRYREMARLGI
jgi:two-component SAPR family response regulator